MKLVHYSSNYYHAALFVPPYNHPEFPRNKPATGGLWTSPCRAEYGWKAWCKDNGFRKEALCKRFYVRLKSEARIYKIDSYADLLKMPHVKFDKYATYIDFVYLSKLYDAIWLTTKGELETRIPGLYDETLPFESPDLYGWDCETILILNHRVIERC